MIVELKMIKAHIICKESNKIASCNPVLKPHTKYDSSYDFWVFKSIQNALESRPLEKDEHIMAVMVNEASLISRSLDDLYNAKEIITEDFITFSDVKHLLSHVQSKPVTKTAIENIRLLFESEFMENFPYYHNRYYALVPFERHHNEFIKNETVIKKPVMAYLSLDDLLKSLNSKTISDYSFNYGLSESAICCINTKDGTVEYLSDGKVNIPEYIIVKNEHSTLNEIEVPLTSEVAPEFVIMHHIECCSDSMLEKYIVNDNTPSRIKALAVKRIDFENICKASDLWHCFQIIMPLLTDSDEAIQLALIDNPSLYKFDDLRIAVLKVLQYSKSREVASKAQAIMAEDWFKMVRRLNENAETCLPFENPVKEDFLSLYPSLTKNLSMADYHNLNPDTEEDF